MENPKRRILRSKVMSTSSNHDDLSHIWTHLLVLGPTLRSFLPPIGELEVVVDQQQANSQLDLRARVPPPRERLTPRPRNWTGW